MPYRHTIKVSEEVYRKLLDLTKRYNLESPNQLLETLLSKGVTLSEVERVTPSEGKIAADCIARRARKGDKPLNVYFLECKSGAKAIVPKETLADLSNRFKLKIVVEE
jgi:predicted CopG family antitoxin